MTPSNRTPEYALDAPIRMRIDVVVEIGQRDGFRVELESRLHRLIGELVEDLCVRLDLDLLVRSPGAGDLGHGQLHAVHIDGKPCRVDRTLRLPDDSSPVAVADAILATLFQNRSLLVTDRLVDAVLGLQPVGVGPEPAAGSIGIVRRALEDAIERCFDIHAALELCGVALNGGEDSDYAAEQRAAMHFSRTIQVEVGRAQYDATLKAVKDPTTSKERVIDGMAEMMRDGLFYELGIRTPPLEIVFGEEFDDQEFRVRINRLRGPMRRGLTPDEVLVNDTIERLTMLNINGKEAVNPANGVQSAIIPLESAQVCEQAGLTTWDAAGYIILSIAAVVRRHASTLFTIAQAEYDLRQLDQAFPMPVFNILERYPVVTVTRVLRGLLAEEVSIRDLRGVLEAMLELNGTTDVDLGRYIVFMAREAHFAASKKPVDSLAEEEIIEFVRHAMKRFISHKYARGGNTLAVYLLDPEIETRMQEPAALDDSKRNQLIEAVGNEVGKLPPTAQNPVVLTTIGVRARLRRELEKEFPQLAVLSYQELSLDLNIQPITRISWPS